MPTQTPPRPSTSKHGTGDETAFAPRNAPPRTRNKKRARAGNAAGKQDERAASIAPTLDKQGEEGNENENENENDIAPPHDKHDEAKGGTKTRTATGQSKHEQRSP